MGGGIAPTTVSVAATGLFRTDHLYGAAAALRSLQHPAAAALDIVACALTGAGSGR